MLAAILVWLAVVGLVMTGYALVWLLCPQLRAWMEAPRDQFLEQQRDFPSVVRERPHEVGNGGLSGAPSPRRHPSCATPSCATTLAEERQAAPGTGSARPGLASPNEGGAPPSRA